MIIVCLTFSRTKNHKYSKKKISLGATSCSHEVSEIFNGILLILDTEPDQILFGLLELRSRSSSLSKSCNLPVPRKVTLKSLYNMIDTGCELERLLLHVFGIMTDEWPTHLFGNQVDSAYRKEKPREPVDCWYLT